MFSLRPSGALSAAHIMHFVKKKGKGHPEQRARSEQSIKSLMPSGLGVDISEHAKERRGRRRQE